MLDVFDIKLGSDAKMPRLDADNTGLVAVQMLDAIQTVVDVLTDNDGGKGYDVTFTPGLDAYTDRSAKRHIVVSAKPLLDAKPGDPLTKVAAVMTGFAVHEVGHTKLNFFDAVKDRWPGKQLPLTLANIIEDVVLEERTVARYPGFADHGEGNVFRPTLEWVAERTCPKTPLEWSGSTGHKVNVTGQVVRYRDFVTFDTDAVTVHAVDFLERWGERITADLTPSGCVELIADWLDYVQTTLSEDKPEPPTPPTTECEFPFGDSKQSIPNEEDDDETEPKGSGGGNDETEDGDDDGQPGGDTEGEDGDDEGGTEGGDEDGGDDDGDGEGKGDGPGRSGDGNDADTMNRGEAPKGTNDGDGKGGSGQSVSEAGDDEGDPDYGFDEADLDETFDDLANKDKDTYQQDHVARAEQDERVTTRLDAGAHGKMRVIFR